MNSKNSSLSRRNGTAMIQPKMSVAAQHAPMTTRNKIGAGLIMQALPTRSDGFSRPGKQSTAKIQKQSFNASEHLKVPQPRPSERQIVTARNFIRPNHANMTGFRDTRTQGGVNLDRRKSDSHHSSRDSQNIFKQMKYFATESQDRPGKIKSQASLFKAKGQPGDAANLFRNSKIATGSQSKSTVHSRPESTKKRTPTVRSNQLKESGSTMEGSNNSQRSSVQRQRVASSRVSSSHKSGVAHQKDTAPSTGGIQRSVIVSEMSTMLSRSDEPNQQVSSGLPLYPKKKKVFLMSNAQSRYGPLTVNKTPKPIPQSCSHGQQANTKGLYNSVQQVDQKVKEGRSSERAQVDSKIKKFDFRDYDDQIEEQLRIPKKQQQRKHENTRYQASSEDDDQLLQSIIKRQSLGKEVSSERGKAPSGKNTPNMISMQEQRVSQERQTRIKSSMYEQNKHGQQQRPHGSTLKSKDRSDEKNFDETLRDTGNAAIDELKLQQYQDVIKRVRLGLDDTSSRLLHKPKALTSQGLRGKQESKRYHHQKAESRLDHHEQPATSARQQRPKNLQIEIPPDEESEGTHAQNGEENLVPSTEKKSRSKNSANSIPTSQTRMRLMMTSTHLAVQKNANAALRPDPPSTLHAKAANSTRNDRYAPQIEEDLKVHAEQAPMQQQQITRLQEDAPKSMESLADRRGATKVAVKTHRGSSQGYQASTKPQIVDNRASSETRGTEKGPGRCLGMRSSSESQIKSPEALRASKALKISQGPSESMWQGIEPAFKIIIPNDDPTRTSNKRTGVVRAYAANTNQGLVRNYNEDRVSIITNLLPPKSRTDVNVENWPRCSYFAIYDGHGGSLCADYLRDNLHQFVINEPCFPVNPRQAIISGFQKAERAFINRCYDPVTKTLTDKSGSCAIVVLIVGDMVYVANVGDSRALLSANSGRQIYPLSLDHKPGDDGELARIHKAGGQIYFRTTRNQVETYDESKKELFEKMNMAGPLRVLPGRLSVARTFGDPEAKIPELGGNPNVVIHDPDVKSFQLKPEHDYIALGCDGIFDKLTNEETANCVWRAAHDNKHHHIVKGSATDVHKLSGVGIDYILKNSLLRRSLDNVTAVLIAFSGFKQANFGHPDPAMDARHHRTEAAAQAVKEKAKTLERTQSANLPRDGSKRAANMIPRTAHQTGLIKEHQGR